MAAPSHRVIGGLAALLVALPGACFAARGAAVPPRVSSPADPYCDTESPVPADHVLVAGDVAGAKLAGATGGRVTGRVPQLGAWELRYADPAAARTAAGAIRALPGVTAADVETAYRVLGRPRHEVVPNDPYRSKQWGLRKIHAYAGWTHEVGLDSPVTVAVIDTGIDLEHPDLAGRVSAGINVIDPQASAQDDMMHGTHVAGIIGADTDNRVGVSGMSWGAQLMPVKAMNHKGTGSSCDVLAGMVWASANGARVLNLSLGSPEPCPLLMQRAVDFAAARNVVTVAAAGNSAKQHNPALSPGDCTGVLTVAATDPSDHVASFSEFGPQVRVSAPGVHVLSTFIDVKHQKHVYAYLDGTSMATPFVAGLAALLLAKHPAWTPVQVMSRITGTAHDLGPKGWDPHFGFGLIDVARALA